MYHVFDVAACFVFFWEGCGDMASEMFQFAGTISHWANDPAMRDPNEWIKRMSHARREPFAAEIHLRADVYDSMVMRSKLNPYARDLEVPGFPSGIIESLVAVPIYRNSTLDRHSATWALVKMTDGTFRVLADHRAIVVRTDWHYAVGKCLWP